MRKLSAIGLLPVAEAHLVQLGDAIDQLGHGLAEFAGERGATERRVFQRVVQDRCNDRFRIHAELGEDAGYGDRMGDIGLTAFARLPVVRHRTHFIGAQHNAPRAALADRQCALLAPARKVAVQTYPQQRDAWPPAWDHDAPSGDRLARLMKMGVALANKARNATC